MLLTAVFATTRNSFDQNECNVGKFNTGPMPRTDLELAFVVPD
jgi:hypothetical protein